MTKDEIEELNRDCRRATKLLLRTYLGTTSLSYKDLAAQIGYSEHQTRNFLNDAERVLPPFETLFRMCGLLKVPGWPYFRTVLKAVTEAELPLPFEEAKGVAMDDPDCKLWQMCLAVKAMIARGVANSGFRVDVIAAETGLEVKRLHEIMRMNSATLPTWKQWFALCAVLQFPQWKTFLLGLSDKAKEQVTGVAPEVDSDERLVYFEETDHFTFPGNAFEPMPGECAGKDRNEDVSHTTTLRLWERFRYPDTPWHVTICGNCSLSTPTVAHLGTYCPNCGSRFVAYRDDFSFALAGEDKKKYDALYDTIWSQHHRRSILGEPLPKPICFTESFE